MNTQHLDPDHHPKVFISYSWDSSDHKNRILEIANRLRNEGVDCLIDQYEEFPPKGWLHWMRTQVEWAEFVLIICTLNYHRRFYGDGEAGKGKGVAWEGAIIAQNLYDQYGENTKFLPVLFFTEDEKYIPITLIHYTHYYLDTEEGYKKLYAYLTNQRNILMPKLGNVQLLPPHVYNLEPLPPREYNQNFDKLTQNSVPQNQPTPEVGADPTGTTESKNTPHSEPQNHPAPEVGAGLTETKESKNTPYSNPQNPQVPEVGTDPVRTMVSEKAIHSMPQNHLVPEVGADPMETTESKNTPQPLTTNKPINKVFIFTVLSVIVVILFAIRFQILHYPATENKITDFQYPATEKKITDFQYSVTANKINDFPYPATEKEINDFPYPATEKEINDFPYPATEKEINDFPYPATEKKINDFQYPATEKKINDFQYPAIENKITDFQSTPESKTEVMSINNPVYINLEKLLKTKKFKEADQETFNLMRSIAKLKNNDINLDGKKDILNFDCEALRTIDMLWTVNSNNSFGFSTQNQIWLEEGGKLGNYDGETSDNFANRVGWDVKKKSFLHPIAQYSCQFNEEKRGNLPCQVNVHIFEEGIPYIAERLKYCNY